MATIMTKAYIKLHAKTIFGPTKKRESFCWMVTWIGHDSQAEKTKPATNNPNVVQKQSQAKAEEKLYSWAHFLSLNKIPWEQCFDKLQTLNVQCVAFHDGGACDTNKHHNIRTGIFFHYACTPICLTPSPVNSLWKGKINAQKHLEKYQR